jgi:hypothetical protein
MDGRIDIVGSAKGAAFQVELPIIQRAAAAPAPVDAALTLRPS